MSVPELGTGRDGSRLAHHDQINRQSSQPTTYTCLEDKYLWPTMKKAHSWLHTHKKGSDDCALISLFSPQTLIEETSGSFSLPRDGIFSSIRPILSARIPEVHMLGVIPFGSSPFSAHAYVPIINQASPLPSQRVQLPEPPHAGQSLAPVISVERTLSTFKPLPPQRVQLPEPPHLGQFDILFTSFLQEIALSETIRRPANFSGNRPYRPHGRF